MPWELLGWGTFAAVLAGGVLLWVGVSWVVAAFLTATGMVGLGLIALLTSAHHPNGEKTPRSERPSP